MSAVATAGGDRRAAGTKHCVIAGPPHRVATVGSTGIGRKSPVDNRISRDRKRANVPLIRLKGAPVPASDPGLRRVSVHAGAAVADLALPAAVPVAVLIPSIVDILEGRGVDGPADPEARRYRLCRPGTPALDASATLAQNDIRDGAVLVLTESPTRPPVLRHDDAAEAVSATLETARPGSHARRDRTNRLAGAVAASLLTGIGALALTRNTLSTSVSGAAASAGAVALLGAMVAHRAYRDATAGLALSVIATAFAAVAGFSAVPGAPGIPNVLLAATAAAVASVLAMRVSGCGAVTLTAIACVALVIAGAALVGVLTAAPPHAVGSVAALASLGLIGVAARMSIALTGLSPRPASAAEPETADRLAGKAIRADSWLAGLLAAFSSSAAVGAIATVLAGAPRLSCIAFGALTGALLLLRARSVDAGKAPALVIAGIAVTATTFGVAALRMPEHGAWITALAATLAAAAIYLGFAAISLSPVARRGVEVLERLALVAMAPLTCWVCGLYGAVRGLSLT
ncbi:type VII secretion integral membrane protein EccD [Mycobacterium heidelbergense]|nr:type VII secretion integral membrane protein EccD [Mycobacterium heidelbergense]